MALSITQVWPAVGKAGTEIQIIGTDLDIVDQVFFGTTPATFSRSFYVGGSYLNVTVPAGSGVVDLKVVDLGTSTEAVAVGGFTYATEEQLTIPNVMLGVSPIGGTLTIDGSGFQPGAVVYIGGSFPYFPAGAEALTTTYVSPTRLTAAVPARSMGTWYSDVTTHFAVVLPDGQGVVRVYRLTFVGSLLLSAITPNSGDDGGGTTVTITGSNFRAGVSVTVAGAPVQQFQRVSSTVLQFKTPPNPGLESGPVNVVVTNPAVYGIASNWNQFGGFTYTQVPTTKYGRLLEHLLPPGKLWDLETRSRLRRLLVAAGDEFERVEDRGAALVAESDPRTATETISDWERILSLPDERVPVLSSVLDERRTAVVQKLVGRGGQNYGFFEVLCAACGWPLNTINRFPVLREGFRVDDRCFDATFAYSIEVVVEAPGEGALSPEQFEAVIRSRVHAHIQVKFTYL